MNTLVYSSHADEASVLSLVLQQVGGMVRVVRDLAAVLSSWPDQPADFIVLAGLDDSARMLETLRQLRAQTPAPVVVIGDQFREADQVALYDEGADLVVLRPYSVRLLIAEIRSLQRRSEGVPYFSLPTLSRRGVDLDPAARTVSVAGGQPVRLTQLEFRLLYTLMTHAGQIIPSERIVDLVWGYSGDGNRELVRGLVQRLRVKVEPDPHNPIFILTEPGVGYYFDR
jgi:DNA-binding response OmpR family regulator